MLPDVTKVTKTAEKKMKNITKTILLIFIITSIMCLDAQTSFAKRAIIPTRGKVNSFGTYSFAGKLDFDIKNAGEQEIGKIVIEGTYNGEYPWIMRIYTDNTNYTGIAGSVKPQSNQGLISTDGRFSIPLMIDIPTMNAVGYKTIPDISQPEYKTYRPDKLNKAGAYTDCIIMGIDPRNEAWVSGSNGILFDSDDNTIGDMTAQTPITIKFRGRFDERAVATNYTANLYVEIITCP